MDCKRKEKRMTFNNFVSEPYKPSHERDIVLFDGQHPNLASTQKAKSLLAISKWDKGDHSPYVYRQQFALLREDIFDADGFSIFKHC